ncbi:MAG: molybdopterin dinucleotide binding domain-containing protein, partial [Acetobacteraceae bacterium]
IVLQLYVEPLQRFRLAADGHGEIQPPEDRRAGIRQAFDPLPFWYPAREQAMAETAAAYPLHAITQRPMPMYHAWHSQNAWLRQIHASNRLYVNRRTAFALGLADDDWVWAVSRQGGVKCQIRLMEGVNPDTVWTWNAIGKRAGAWGLGKNAPEARQGFLLNHLISAHLPDGELSNSDPITGQAAWYDLRVRLEKTTPGEAGETAPQPPLLAPLPDMPHPPRILRFNASSPAGNSGGRELEGAAK